MILALRALILAALSVAPGTGLSGIAFHQAPPNFAIPSPRGTEYLSQLQGHVVIIDFWATWCDVCTEEMRYFVRAKQTFGDRVDVVTISDELPDVAASYFRTWNIGLPLVDDGEDAIHRIYSISKIPDTLVLDPQGRVSYVSVGGLSWDELQKAIEQASGASF
ncbi:MAG: TlpA family protein disulfide reductase [Candidatus Eremiobacteraeota bacterium]|nr:TlpA family protein disulfide reductase [Candidatus Eremiobacteraeota bacterium]